MTESSLARAFWITGRERSSIRSERLRLPGADEVLVQALRSGISRGTEMLVYRGQVPPSQHELMRCPFQEGGFDGPLKYGYSSVGLVLEGPSALQGQRVFCLHPHQDRYVVPAQAVLPLPEAVPSSRAVLAANLETAINGLWDAAPRLGDRIAVVGAGVVGCLMAVLAARLPGVQVELVDPDARRASLAMRLGCGFAVPDQAAGEADLVIHASGHPAGLTTAIGLAGFEATVLEMSWYGDKLVPLPLGESFHSRRLTLRASQVGSVATAQRARWSHRRRLSLALSLLVDPVFDGLLGDESAFEALPGTFEQLAGTAGDGLCPVITYS